MKSLAFGDTKSSTEVYILTDWFCPACRAVEPEILKGARKAMRQAKVIFVDYPIHPETYNYIPYNLSFIVREKEKYLRIREALAILARKTKEPTPEDVQAAVSPLGVKYVQLNYADVVAGMQLFQHPRQEIQGAGHPFGGCAGFAYREDEDLVRHFGHHLGQHPESRRGGLGKVAAVRQGFVYLEPGTRR